MKYEDAFEKNIEQYESMGYYSCHYIQSDERPCSSCPVKYECSRYDRDVIILAMKKYSKIKKLLEILT